MPFNRFPLSGNKSRLGARKSAPAGAKRSGAPSDEVQGCARRAGEHNEAEGELDDVDLTEL